MTRFILDPYDPPRFSPEELAATDAQTPEEIEGNARSDPDNPPLTEDELERLRLARAVQQIRKASGLTREDFARRYHIDADRLESFERGRVRPDTALMAYLLTIHREPEAVSRALASPVAA